MNDRRDVNRPCQQTLVPVFTGRQHEGGRNPQPDDVFVTEGEVARLISVCSLGLVVLGAHRRFDRLLDAIALYAETNDLMWIE